MGSRFVAAVLGLFLLGLSIDLHAGAIPSSTRVPKLRSAAVLGVSAVGIDVDVYYGVRTRYEPVGEHYVAPIAPAPATMARI